MRSLVCFALALVLSCFAASVSAQSSTQVSAPQLTILKAIANEWPALKDLSAGAWNDSNLENVCMAGSVAFASVCNATGWITTLRFDSNFGCPMLGTMAPSLSLMSALTTLSFTGVLNGAPDPNLGNLKELTTLELKNCVFSGPFPSSWSGMTKLQTFSFIDALDQQEQAFPSFLSSLTAITKITFEYVQFSGSIPEFVGQISSLARLTISGVPLLKGPIPTSLTQSQNLRSIFLLDLPSFNQTSGPSVVSIMPQDWSQATSLTTLSIDTVPITGSLPEFPPPKIELLEIYATPIGGVVPQSLIDSPYLTSLVLVNTNVGGTLPSVTDKSGTLLQDIQIKDSKLTALHEDLLKNDVLGYLDVSNNLISGPLPSKVGIDDSSLQLSIYSLNFANNAFSGPLPVEIFSKAPALDEFYVNNNNLEGEIPSELAKKTNWGWIDLSFNSFTGTIPDEGKWNASANLRGIRMSNNQLEGKIPHGLFKRTATAYFAHFYFQNNRLDLCDLPEPFNIADNLISDCKISDQTPIECGCPGKWPLKCTKGAPIFPTCPAPIPPSPPASSPSSSPSNPSPSGPSTPSNTPRSTVVPTSPNPTSVANHSSISFGVLALAAFAALSTL